MFCLVSAIPYTIRISTGDGEDNGTTSNVWIKIIGPKKLHTGQLYLELVQKNSFAPGSTEIFSLEAVDVKEVKRIEVGCRFLECSLLGCSRNPFVRK